MIAHGSRPKRVRTEKLSRLVGEILDLEDCHKAMGSMTSVSLTQKRAELRTALDQWYIRFRESFQRVLYKHVDKCPLDPDSPSRTYSPHVSTTKEGVQHEPADITAAFEEFYQGLYDLSALESLPDDPELSLHIQDSVRFAPLPVILEEEHEASFMP